ncbi:Uncharacterized protein BP5553_09159 [Venustampulla echinocandica]|uniref:Zn(2)-C6 fungal-type domain-containing protein n=1 Tax=Venustampulla echinocandica TaxID=2656787 RepID=A0A370TE00_9HELO|nr:Uncharacterized protein BP5553_09159 [Venustampulla echinocandica]RDL32703.1 Uncharacterized protein BP5553_09159 [Venustampulla echinocandica]
MSLRRRSCDACFKRRQKCDRSSPVCMTCQRLNKLCHYPLPPPESADNATPFFQEVGNGIAVYQPAPDQGAFPDLFTSYVSDDVDQFLEQELGLGHESLDLNLAQPTPSQVISLEVMSIMIPNLLGPLGDLQPLMGNTQTWQWVIAHLKACPEEFSRRGNNIFLHEQLYLGALPRPVRAAFTVSAAACRSMNKDNRSMIFKVLDAEVLEILQLPDEDVIQNLAKLQALVLYHIIRLFYGGVEQRVMAELQESLLMTRALRLLQRAQSDIRDGKLDWHSWILAECTRRTVLITFMLCGVYSILTRGICLAFPTLQMLPVSSESTAWISQDGYLQLANPNKTVAYSEFTNRWLCAPREVESFEKLMLVACKGVETVEAYSGLGL